MNVDGKLQSRRALLSLGVCSLGTGSLLGGIEPDGNAATNVASTSGNRALVCVYLFGGEGGRRLPAVRELQDLYRAGTLAVVRNIAAPDRNRAAPSTPGELMALRYGALRFLPNGFATPEWAARMAGISPQNGAGAFTFDSGISMLSMDGRVREGGRHENPALRQAMNQVALSRTAFPATGLGRQLEDVSRLLGAGNRLDLNRPVFLAAISGFTKGARKTGALAERYQELGQALAAFHAATVELGMERQVTTYTDAELPVAQKDKPAGLGVRLVLGGSVRERDCDAGGNFTTDTYMGSLTRWQGVRGDGLQQLFPEFAAPGLTVLA